jgi:hypothetical protein
MTIEGSENCTEACAAMPRCNVCHKTKKLDGIKTKYNELLFAVEGKFDNETRHETALRYIKEAETRGPSSQGAREAKP